MNVKMIYFPHKYESVSCLQVSLPINTSPKQLTGIVRDLLNEHYRHLTDVSLENRAQKLVADTAFDIHISSEAWNVCKFVDDYILVGA